MRAVLRGLTKRLSTYIYQTEHPQVVQHTDMLINLTLTLRMIVSENVIKISKVTKWIIIVMAFII